MKVIIAGSRSYFNYSFIKEHCDIILKDIAVTEIVTGAYYGVDQLGEQYAADKGYKFTPFPADWRAFGGAAGPMRNRKMAEYGHMLIAFPAKNSPGTQDMINQAKNRNLIIKVVQLP